MLNNTTGSFNTAFGNESLRFNTTASNNTAVGYQAGFNVTTGFETVAVGTSAGAGITTGRSNVAVGYNTMSVNAVASNFNTAIGGDALQVLSSGEWNFAGAKNALLANTTGSFNTAVGGSALSSNTTASYNTAVGYQCGTSITTGNFNTVIGNRSGTTITTGFTNILIGNAVEASSASAGNEINMGNSIAGKGSNTGFISPNGGGVFQGNNSSTWSTTSDQRLKKNIVDNDDGLDKINGIRVRNFEYRLPEEVDPELKPTDAIGRAGVQLGVIAQELQQVLPGCVKQESTGVLTVDTDNLTWYLVNAVKQLNAKVEALEAQLKGTQP
jgi:hypothetical protein